MVALQKVLSIFIKSITYFFLIYLMVFNLSACRESAETNADLCPMVIDTVSIIDKQNFGNETYYMVLRIAGWSDKTEIIEVYNAKPVFNHCAKSNIKPIFGDSLEMEQSVSHVYVDVPNNTLSIEYVSGKPNISQNKNLKLELR
jgi:hypothetical protein